MTTLAKLLRSMGVAERGRRRRGRSAFFEFALATGFMTAFATIGAKLVVTASNAPPLPSLSAVSGPQQVPKVRPDIVDRNGRLLATDIRVFWLYANPGQIVDPDDAAEKAANLFPDLNQAALAKKFRDKKKTFEWVKRGLTPNQAKAVHNLGIPGFYLVSALQRVYPAGAAAAHIIGATNVDNGGIGGVERFIDEELGGQVIPDSLAERPIVKLSLDLGVQHALSEELNRAKERYKANAALGLVLDVRNGEVLASASLPDFDPNKREEAYAQNRQNRVVSDAYELGSVFKSFTIAMALDEGVVTPGDELDTATPLNIGPFVLREHHGSGRRRASVTEIFTRSSNLGTARIALKAGISRQKQFLKAMGLFEKLETEAGTSPAPILPKVWRPANAVTIAYGHGIAVPPLQFASAAATLVNGGRRIKPTFLIASPGREDAGQQVMKPETSAKMRELMRLVILNGTGKRAAVEGVALGGKTGTALKVKDGHYTHDLVNTFIAAFPIDKPRYLVMVTLDEPKPEEEGKPNEAAYNAAPAAGAVVKRIAPMLDIVGQRRFDEAAATPYERNEAPASRRLSFWNESHEIGGAGQGYPVSRRPVYSDRPRNYGVDRR